jgi:hypothetical protein
VVLWYDMVWYGITSATKYGVVWYGTIPYHTVSHHHSMKQPSRVTQTHYLQAKGCSIGSDTLSL